MSSDLETRLARALRAIDSKGRAQVKKLTRELEIAEDRLRKAGDAVYHAKHKLAEAKKKVDAKELKSRIAARIEYNEQIRKRV